MGGSDGGDRIHDAEELELDPLVLDQEAAATRAHEMGRPPQLARPDGAAMRNILCEDLVLGIKVDGGDALSLWRAGKRSCADAGCCGLDSIDTRHLPS